MTLGAQILLAGHAPQGVTLRHYRDFSILDLWAEIRKLAPIRTNAIQTEAVAATGTENARPADSRGVVLPVVQNTCRKGVKVAATGRIDQPTD